MPISPIIGSIGSIAMREIKSKVNNDQYQKIQAYVKKNEISIWKLVKDSVLEKINNTTLDDFGIK